MIVNTRKKKHIYTDYINARKGNLPIIITKAGDSKKQLDKRFICLIGFV